MADRDEAKMDERHARYVIAVDLGATNTRCAIVDEEGETFVLSKEKTRCPEVERQLIQVISATLANAVRRGMKIVGIGIGLAALVDQESGVARYAPNISGCVDIPLRGLIEKQTGIPTVVGKDSNLAALGEKWLGTGKPVQNFVLITLGTGLGCGIIINGEIYVGSGFAGEFGHTLISDASTRCNCGGFGCLESLAGGPAISRLAEKKLRKNDDSMMTSLAKVHPGQMTAGTVFKAAVAKDKMALQIVDEIGMLIGKGLVNLVYLLHPERIALGGGLAQIGELLMAPIEKTLLERCYFIRRGLTSVDVVLAELGDDAGLIGAAKLAFERSSK